MDYITPADMAKAEERAAKEGIGVEKLMENAGAGVARAVDRLYGPMPGKRVLVVTGNGNNGGDGFVTARYLAEWRSKVTVLLLCDPEEIRTTEAKVNWNRLNDCGVERWVAKDEGEISRLVEEFYWAEVIIDAVFGTGIKGEVREPQKTAIRMMNESRGKKVALDIPSGLDPLTGEAKGTTFRADVTVALHRPKVGLKRGGKFAGKVFVVPIGIP